MTKQIDELESVIIKLEQVTSLFNCMFRSYFEDTPNYGDNTERALHSHYLVSSFEDYTNIMNVIRDMVDTQTSTLSEATYTLNKIRLELRQLAERNLSLLNGGDING